MQIEVGRPNIRGSSGVARLVWASWGQGQCDRGRERGAFAGHDKGARKAPLHGALHGRHSRLLGRDGVRARPPMAGRERTMWLLVSSFSIIPPFVYIIYYYYNYTVLKKYFMVVVDCSIYRLYNKKGRFRFGCRHCCSRRRYWLLLSNASAMGAQPRHSTLDAVHALLLCTGWLRH